MNRQRLNLRAMLLNNKPKMREFEAKDIEIIRPAAAINPLMTYNFTGANDGIFPNDATVLHGDYGYVGGDTVEYTFDMGTKIANSVAECPVKIYRSVNPALLNPTNVNWAEQTTQSELDKLKTQDTNVYSGNSNALNGIYQMMVEIDLTPLCNKFYGGSNTAMKAALKSIQADVWAMGSGANGGVKADGVKMSPWSAQFSIWGDAGSSGSNSTNAIAKMTCNFSAVSAIPNFVNSQNKLYILIHSQYASDGNTIASSVSLDYLSIKVSLAKTADTVKPKQVNLGKYWAMVVKGFSPNWDGATGVTNSRIIDIGGKWDIRWSPSFKFQLTKYGGTTVTIQSTPPAFNKYQCFNILVGQNAGGMFIYVLKNNDVIAKVTNTDTQEVKGIFPLIIGTNQSDTGQINAFTEAFHLIPDLQAIGKSNGFTEAEAISMLKGVKHINEFNALVNGDFSQGITGWANSSGAISAFNKELTYTATTLHTAARIEQMTDSSIVGHKYYLRGDILPKYKNSTQLYMGGAISGSAPITPNMWNTVSACVTATATARFRFYHSTEASYVVGDEIKFKNVFALDLTEIYGAGNEPTQAQMDALFTQASTNPLGIVNKNLFSLDKVQLHASARIEGNSIVLSATGTFQSSSLEIPVLPNNRYELTLKCGTNHRVLIDGMYNNITVQPSLSAGYYNNAATIIVTIGANTNKLKLTFNNGTATTGTFTFSDIELKLKM
jgi:hypothetical protein